MNPQKTALTSPLAIEMLIHFACKSHHYRGESDSRKWPPAQRAILHEFLGRRLVYPRGTYYRTTPRGDKLLVELRQTMAQSKALQPESDPHKARAAIIFGVAVDEVTSHQRQVGKLANIIEAVERGAV